MQKSFLLLPLLAFGSACDQPKPKKETTESQCTLGFGDLSDSIWVMLDHEKNEEPNSRHRIKFHKDGEKLKATYPASHDNTIMLDYECSVDEAGSTINCHTIPNIDKVCIALIAGDAKCVKKPMQKFYADFSDEMITASRERMKKQVREKKKNGSWSELKKRYNNQATHLMDVLSIRIDKNQCNLSITDNYQTIFNGEMLENANPVGTSNFAKWDKSKLMWSTCKDNALVSTTEAVYPSAIDRNRKYPKDSTLHFWYWQNEQTAKWSVPQEGCEYKYDVYFDQVIEKEGLIPEVQKIVAVPEPKKGKKSKKSKKDDKPAATERLIYHVDKTFPKLSNKSYPFVYAMDITKTCGEKTEKHVTCSAVHIIPPPKKAPTEEKSAEGEKTKQ